MWITWWWSLNIPDSIECIFGIQGQLFTTPHLVHVGRGMEWALPPTHCGQPGVVQGSDGSTGIPSLVYWHRGIEPFTYLVLTCPTPRKCMQSWVHGYRALKSVNSALIPFAVFHLVTLGYRGFLVKICPKQGTNKCEMVVQMVCTLHTPSTTRSIEHRYLW